MFKKKEWLSVEIIRAFFLAAVSCVVLSLQALCKRENRDAGILTVQFVDLLEIKLIDSRSVLTGDSIKELGSKIPGASAAVTQASSITDQVQSVASSVLGAVETPINDAILKNFSLRTKRYCVGYSNRNDCENLLIKLSKFWPKFIISRKTCQLSRKKPSESFKKYVARITPATIQAFLIVDLSAVLILATLLVFSL
ncbi:hypothetical protein BDBG_06408 [Blastomyces gilchristii SLH14081]|uniref:Uncharacterized protein n=1 Tax=Blastomyces gilchristii (strain SLH14081) TaxID=559298 RepID=A0A179UU39_BLAGS|nr:uncharacterized protein BDBG_06408 [Blastomyces gilchristii SLH14081]OAT10587.1 hypothetical protein BDBG_06408 [Blastomyces gilchristii SLH14081]